MVVSVISSTGLIEAGIPMMSPNRHLLKRVLGLSFEINLRRGYDEKKKGVDRCQCSVLSWYGVVYCSGTCGRHERRQMGTNHGGEAGRDALGSRHAFYHNLMHDDIKGSYPTDL